MNLNKSQHPVHVCHPVAFISVNKNHVVFDDMEGTKNVTLANTKEVKKFVHFLQTQTSF